MRRTRDWSGSKVVHLYPHTRECPACQEPLEERYHKERWIVQLGQKLHVISHFLECHTRGCRLREAVYRPEGEDILALRGYTFGIDVIALIGELRYSRNLSIPEIHHQLHQEELSISVKEVALLCEVYLALVTTVAREDKSLIKELRDLGGIVLAIDGVQPEKGNETLYILRDVRLGRVLVARNLLSSATPEIEKLLDEVICLGVPILGVISDKQESIRLAVSRRLEGVPHQLCHYHYLRDLAQPVCEADRHVKKEIKKGVRSIRQIELEVKDVKGLEAEVVRDYCLAIRTVLQKEGHYPLEPAGVRLYKDLKAISDSLERAISLRPSSLFERLRNRLSIVEFYQREVEHLDRVFGLIRHINQLLDTSGSEEEARHKLLSFVESLRESAVEEKMLSWLEHFEHITRSFAPYLFAYLKQPLLPRTNNELEIFISRMKKSRRQATGRKNTQEFILREGSWVAILFGLPPLSNLVTSFSQVDFDKVRQTLNALRRTSERSKCWRIRRDLPDYLLGLEKHLLPPVCDRLSLRSLRTTQILESQLST